MSKKKTEKRKHLVKSRKDLKEIKMLRQKAKLGLPGAADELKELEARRQARVLGHAVKSPLSQICMEPKRL